MASIQQARRSLRHRPGWLSLALGALMALSWVSTVLAVPVVAQQPAQLPKVVLLQQESPTSSPTASLSPTPSPSLTPSLSATLTLTTTTPTLTATLTGSPAANLTVTLTLSPAPSATLAPPSAATPTWTPPFPSPVPPTAAAPAVLPSPTEAGPTATLMPLPTVTYQFPGVTPRGDLLSLAQPTAVEVLPKGQKSLASSFSFGRGWLFGAIILLWAGLIAWFVLAHVIARRQ